MARATTHGLRKPASVTAMNPLVNCFPKVLHQAGRRRWTACQVRKRNGLNETWEKKKKAFNRM